MIITLNSTNQNNYQFRNYFNETLSLKQGSIVTVKNIQIKKDFFVDIVEGANQFQLTFDHEEHGPYTFTIPAGRYSRSDLEEALKEVYNSATFGYNLDWELIASNDLETQATVNLQVNGYRTPPAPAFLPIDPYTPALINANNTQVSSLVISKTAVTTDFDDNHFLYKSYLSNKAVNARGKSGWPEVPKGTTYGRIMVQTQGTATANTRVGVGLVPHDWNGSVQDCVDRGILVEIIGANRRFEIRENSQTIVSHTAGNSGKAGRGLASANDRLFIRQYNGIANSGAFTNAKKQYYGGFMVGAVTPSGTINYCYPYLEKHLENETKNAGPRTALRPSDAFYPVFFFNDQSLEVINVTGNFISQNVSTNHNITNSVITQDFVNTDKTTVSAVVGSVQTITSDQTLSGNNVCGAHSTSSFTQGHVIFSFHSASKEYFIGFSTDSSVVSTSLVQYGYKFGGGNVYVIDNGTIGGVSKTTFTSNDLFKFSLSSSGFPLLEKKTGGSGDYEMIDIPLLDIGLFHEDPVYYLVGFPDQVNSADTYVKVHEESTSCMYGYGDGGDYLKFNPYTLRQTLGYALDSYVWDSTSMHFPHHFTAENEMEFYGSDANTYRVQCPNLPVKSYNGSLGASDKTIATLALDRNGDVRFPIEQRTECLNGDDVLINEIEVEITDEQNNLAQYDFKGDCQITLQIEPHLSP